MRGLVFSLIFGLLPSFVAAEIGPLADEDPGDTLQVIVDRRADEVTLYLSLPAKMMPTVFGVGADALLDDDGTISLDRLFSGTYGLADEVFASTQVSLDEGTSEFDGLSLMVHDPEVLPRFDNPWDAEGAIAVCTSPETVDHLPLDPLRAYLGFYAWKVDGTKPLNLTLPETGRDAITVDVRQFWNFQPVGHETVIVEDGGTVRLVPDASPSVLPLIVGVLAVALASVFLAIRSQRPVSRRAEA